MKKLIALTAAFMMAAPALAAPECRSENVRTFDINELGAPLPPDQSIRIMIMLAPESALMARIQASDPSEYGAIFNELAPALIQFDPDSGEKMNAESFEFFPVLFLHGCIQNGSSIIDAMNALSTFEGIEAATFDVALYEVPILQTPAP